MSIKPAQASVGALELMGMGIALMLDQRQLSEHILATVDGEAIRLIPRHGTRMRKLLRLRPRARNSGR